MEWICNLTVPRLIFYGKINAKRTAQKFPEVWEETAKAATTSTVLESSVKILCNEEYRNKRYVLSWTVHHVSGSVDITTRNQPHIVLLTSKRTKWRYDVCWRNTSWDFYIKRRIFHNIRMTLSYSYINTKASLTLLRPGNTAFAVISLIHPDKATWIPHTKD